MSLSGAGVALADSPHALAEAIPVLTLAGTRVVPVQRTRRARLRRRPRVKGRQPLVHDVYNLFWNPIQLMLFGALSRNVGLVHLTGFWVV